MIHPLENSAISYPQWMSVLGSAAKDHFGLFTKTKKSNRKTPGSKHRLGDTSARRKKGTANGLATKVVWRETTNPNNFPTHAADFSEFIQADAHACNHRGRYNKRRGV